MTEDILSLYNEIKTGTNKFNRTPRHLWFFEKFEILKKLLPFDIDKFSEIDFIITNGLEEYPTCSSCGERVKKVDKQFCSVKCRANDPEQMKTRIKSFKKTITENPDIITKRSKKWKNTVANKSDEEMLVWSNNMSKGRQNVESNMTLEKRKSRAKKLSQSTKKYFKTATFEELKSRKANIRKTRIEKGIIKLDNSDFLMYSRLVRNLTVQTYKKFKEYINPSDLKRGLFSGEDLYHVDHIVSIKAGYENNVPIHIIASEENLQMLLVETNCSKGTDCDSTIEELFNKVLC